MRWASKTAPARRCFAVCVRWLFFVGFWFSNWFLVLGFFFEMQVCPRALGQTSTYIRYTNLLRVFRSTHYGGGRAVRSNCWYQCLGRGIVVTPVPSQLYQVRMSQPRTVNALRCGFLRSLFFFFFLQLSLESPFERRGKDSTSQQAFSILTLSSRLV